MLAIIVVIVCIVIAVLVAFAISKTRTKKQEIENIDRKPYEMLAADFVRVGWPSWGYAVHRAAGQDDRIRRAIKSTEMSLVSYDADSKTALVEGEHGIVYEITPQGCSCPDFHKRNLPCKHMYFAVMEIPDDPGLE